jgi:hypothetical protein
MPEQPDLPYWIDDPLITRAEHRMQLDTDEVASAQAGRTLYAGGCSCDGMKPVGPWDTYAIEEAFDGHMADVQLAAHAVVDPADFETLTLVDGHGQPLSADEVAEVLAQDRDELVRRPAPSRDTPRTQ